MSGPSPLRRRHPLTPDPGPRLRHEVQELTGTRYALVISDSSGLKKDSTPLLSRGLLYYVEADISTSRCRNCRKLKSVCFCKRSGFTGAAASRATWAEAGLNEVIGRLENPLTRCKYLLCNDVNFIRPLLCWNCLFVELKLWWEGTQWSAGPGRLRRGLLKSVHVPTPPWDSWVSCLKIDQ